MKTMECIAIGLFFFAANLFLPMQSIGQVSFSKNHPELNWQTYETDHFKIIFHQGIEALADEVARVAEHVYEPITGNLGVVPPQKTPIIVTDYLDYSNGLATPLGHYIIIWAKSDNKYMTGDIKWLRAVVAHEFAHIVNFWAFRAFPGFWRELLALGFIPTWFLEGIAEFEAEQWCDHRDMLARVVAYHKKLVPYKKMTGFIGADEIDARLVYEQGHSLIRYIAHRFGREKIREIITSFRAMPLSFNLTLKRTIGMSERELFAAWKEEIDSHYEEIFSAYTPVRKIGDRLKTSLQGNYGARWSPDGRTIAVVGIKDYEEGVRELYILDANSRKMKKVAGPFVNSFFSFSPDGKSIVYSQQHIVATGAAINDLFVLNIETNQVKRLTNNDRATDPCFSPDGNEIVYAVHQGTRSNLAILNLKTNEKRIITNFPDWTEVFTPSWSPDGNQIVFSLWDSLGKRDIGLIHSDGAEFKNLQITPEDDRYPAWSPDGNRIAFISYRTGIPNLYLFDPKTSVLQQITDTPGGVFNPTWLPDGKHVSVIAFEKRDSTEVFIIPIEHAEPAIEARQKISWLPFHQLAAQTAKTPASPLSQQSLSGVSKSYCSLTNIRSQILLPYYGKDEKGYQPGIIHLAADPLGKHTLMSSLSYRSRLHFSMDYTNKQFAPTAQIFIEKTTIDHGNFIRVAYKDGRTELLPLYENFWSGSLSLYWNINFGRSLLSNHLLWLRSTFNYRNIINANDYKNINTSSWAYPLLQGWTNYLTLGYVWQTYRPGIYYDIHPKTGWWLSSYIRWGDKQIGSDIKFRQIGFTGVARQTLPIRDHVIALRTGVSFRSGEQPIQSRLSLGGYVIRGISYSQEGDQQLFTNLEYRFPLIKDLGLKTWILYFERFCGALFLDSGKAWGSDLVKLDKIEQQSFASTPWLQTAGIELRHRFYVFGKIPAIVSGGYAIDTQSPQNRQFYYQLGAIF